jgi:hypothetical protein
VEAAEAPSVEAAKPAPVETAESPTMEAAKPAAAERHGAVEADRQTSRYSDTRQQHAGQSLPFDSRLNIATLPISNWRQRQLRTGSFPGRQAPPV